jgi:hypothetical protein
MAYAAVLPMLTAESGRLHRHSRKRAAERTACANPCLHTSPVFAFQALSADGKSYVASAG